MIYVIFLNPKQWFHKIVTLDKHNILSRIASFLTLKFHLQVATSVHNPDHGAIVGVGVFDEDTSEGSMNVTSGIRLRTITPIHVVLYHFYLLDELINANLYKEYSSELKFQFETISYYIECSFTNLQGVMLLFKPFFTGVF